MVKVVVLGAHGQVAQIAERFFYSKSSVINDFKQFYFEIQA